MATIGTGTAMEKNKDGEEDVVEEHNGVYGGKWHIISPEGFKQSAGLDYLKNSWDGSWDDHCMGRKGRIHKYIAYIKVRNVQLEDAFREIYRVLQKFTAYGTKLEIRNCFGSLTTQRIDSVIPYTGDFSINGCQLTFRDLGYIICVTCSGKHKYDLSGNRFENLSQLKIFEKAFKVVKKESVKVKVFIYGIAILQNGIKYILKKYQNAAICLYSNVIETLIKT